MQGVTEISWLGLGFAVLLVLTTLAISRWQGLGLEAKLVSGAVRTVVQLIAIGYILGWVFEINNPWVVAGVCLMQLSFAVWTAGGMQEPALPGSRLIALWSLLPAYVLVVGLLVLVVIAPKPFWEPRILLPLGGMLLGNSLTGVVLALNRYRSGLRDNRETILGRLSLGASWQQAVDLVRREAAQSALLPIVVTMLTVGMVALPGMMTGQIIAGADPVEAVKYQIVVMFMIAASTAIAVTIAIMQITRREQFEALGEG